MSNATSMDSVSDATPVLFSQENYQTKDPSIQAALWKKSYEMNHRLSQSIFLAGVGLFLVVVGLRLQSRLTPGAALMVSGTVLVTTAAVAHFFAFKSHQAAVQANLWYDFSRPNPKFSYVP